jgi:catechol 2,3-dioxygenase
MSANHTHILDSTPGAALAGDTRLGAVELVVADLDRSLAYYRDVLGLRLHRREGALAALGAGGEDLVLLAEQPDARRAGRHAGLFHFALLFDSREELARAALRLAAQGAPISGASDHGTLEALYLRDPDGIGIELAADRPREQWPEPAAYAAGPAPLDLHGLLETVAGEEPTRHAGEGLRMGHVHLQVSDLDAARRFYRDALGFGVVVDIGSAAFLATGGYHHHVGVNVWAGVGIPPAPPDAVGLRHWTLELDGPAELDALRARLDGLGLPYEARESGLLARDPAGIAVLAVAAGK